MYKSLNILGLADSAAFMKHLSGGELGALPSTWIGFIVFMHYTPSEKLGRAQQE